MKINSIYLIAPLLFLYNIASAQYFEGSINYKITVENTLLDSVKFERVKANVGTSSIFYFKNGSYRQTLQRKKGKKEELYISGRNIIFNWTTTDTLIQSDISKPDENILKYEITDSKETILGKKCKELLINYKDRSVIYYYNPETAKVPPLTFQNYKAVNKYFTTEKMGCLFLKVKMMFPQFTVTMTATNIISKKLNDKMFLEPDAKVIQAAVE